MKISCYHLLNEFKKNYYALELSKDDHYGTTWTHRILGFFDQLGRKLGYKVHFEKLNHDLTWWDNSERENLFFHLEHENSKKYKEVIEDVSKVVKSQAEIAMAICYPRDYNKVVEWINDKSQSLLKPKEVIIIVDGWSCEEDTLENARFNSFIITKDDIKKEKKRRILGKEGVYIITD